MLDRSRLLTGLLAVSLVACSSPDDNSKKELDASTDTSADVGTSDTGDDADTDEYIDPTLDTDGDGVTDVDEIRKWGTNPLVKDTDGDGFDDFDEIVTKAFDPEVNAQQFNPRVADVPELHIELLNAPAVGLNYTENSSTTQTVGTERSTQRSQANSRSWGGSQSHATERSHTWGVSVTAGASWSDGASAEVSYNYSETHTTTNEATNEWSQEQATENSQAYARMEEKQKQTGVEIQSGWLEVVVRLSNPSDIAYVLDGLTLTAYRPAPDDPLAIDSIGTMILTDTLDTFEETVLSPNDTFGPAEFAINSLDLDTTKDLLAGSENLVFAPLTYSMRGADNIDFELASTNINARTARLIIDYGVDREREDYRVATVLDQENPGVTVADVFNDFLRIPYEEGTSDWRFGDETDTRDSFTGVTSVRDRAMSADKTSYWIVTHTRTVDSGARTVTDVHNLVLDDYDFSNIELQKGDVLHLVYVEDVDRDGLGLRTELLHGTDPENADTDGDGLSDSFELAGWEVDVDGTTVRYVSIPTEADTDRDGINDGQEYTDGTNPAEPLPDGSPTVDTLDVSYDGFNATVDFAVSSEFDQVARVEVDWGDGSAVDEVTGTDMTTGSATHTYSALGNYTVTVTAYDRFGLPSAASTTTASIFVPDPTALYMNFDGNTDNQRGSNPQLAWQSVTYGADRHGMASRSLDMEGGGTGSYQLVSFNDSPTLSGSFTISAWVYAQGFGAGNGNGANRLMGQDYWFNLYSDDTGISFGGGEISGGSLPDSVKADSNTNLSQDTWYHFAGVVEDLGNGTSAVRLYVDGFLQDEHIANSVFDSPPSCHFYIGPWAQNDCTGTDARQFDEFRGLIDDARVYSRALTDAEVEMLYIATP
ncbi:hypothetical protein FIV42_01205 [Persicimonas caeni]|uniref:PKD domain-containing protein n=1 Tax=Persicimonas caeni TaxID=2292766 RepID=A0A4Y6PM90_PERCE|nr:LamG-like jellyroll fold domain-containing protein [Persicimonas caeni]QDG49401.1 hypothetical protein FIV42_01205 [Persicimonas caeni]QED30622.1 hypothetical protein FRD00_01200 [Persicimonas caeni]